MNLGVNNIFLLVLAVTALDFCSTRPQNYGKSSSCLKKPGSIVPKFKMVGKYANVSLTCPFSAIKYEFFKSCRPIKQSVTKNNKLKISGKTLMLTRFITMDSGMYSCQGTDANGHIKEFIWVLHIPHTNPGSDPTYVERPENEAIMMDCRAFRGKHLFYSHNKRNPTLLQTSRLVGDATSGIYELKLTIDDSGYYYCGNKVQQPGKKDLPRMLLQLTVRELPKVKGKSIAKIGGSVHFECEYSGPQTIAWYKDEKPVTKPAVQQINKAQVKLTNKSHYKSVLKLDLVNVQHSSGGEYACGVEFDNNITVFQTIQLNIFDFVENPIRFHGGDSSIVNSTVIIKCMTNLIHKTKYSLLKRPLFPLNPKPSYKKVKMGPRISDFGSGLFFISPLSAADEGYYKCSASRDGLTIERELLNPVWLTTS